MPEKATLNQIVNFFGRDPDTGGFRSLSDFRTEWLKLSEQDREQIATGIGNGSLTY